MKIIQISQYFPPNCQYGAENFAFHLSKELLNFGHEVYVITAGKDDGGERFVEESYCGLNIFRVYNLQRTHPYKSEKVIDWVSSLLEEIQPDILHIHQLASLSFNIPHLAAEVNIPVFYTLHDFWNLCSNYHFLKDDLKLCKFEQGKQCANCDQHTNSLLRKNAERDGVTITQNAMGSFYESRVADLSGIFESAHKIYYPSRFLGNVYKNAGLPSEKMLYSPYGMDHSKFDNIKPYKNSVPTFGFIGSVSSHKGLEVILKAFNEIPEDTFEMQIYGAPGINQKGYYQSLLDLNKNSSVRFKGHIDNDQVIDFLNNIDALIVPSLWYENAPLVISEAFMTKTPVLCSDIGGMAEMVTDGKNGFHFEVGNEKSLRNHINKIIENPQLLTEFTFPKVRSIIENATDIEKDYREALNVK